MFSKRFLPLAITAVLATATASFATNRNRPTPNEGYNSCDSAHSRRAAVDTVAGSAIGGLRNPTLISRTSGTKIALPLEDVLDNGLPMLAELEMAQNPAAGSTPSSCYPALSFTTSSIPSGTVNVAYTTALGATGGQPPYSWSFGQSSLPSGFAIDSNGNLTGTPTQGGTFNFHVVVSDSLKNSVTGELTLTVAAATQPPPTPPTAPVIRSFSASPSSISAGGSSVLSWTVSGSGVSVRLNGAIAASPTTVSPSATTSYTLSASNKGGTVTQTVTVTVTQSTPPTPPPPSAPVISSFSASPSSISPGGSSVLSWTVSGNGVTVKLNGAAAASPTTVSPSATTSYTLSASNSAGTATQTVTVTVTQSTQPPPPSAPVIQSFSASPTSISAGGSSVLSWTVSGTGVTIKLNGATATSPDTVSPSATTSYTLSASNSGGTATQTVTVTVTPPSSGGGTPTGTALTACGDITATGTYYLANDVSSSGTCFGIDANNITLNLNGHTITYDTGGVSNSPAIEGHDSWSTDNPPITGPSGSAHGGLEVYGGTIVQAVSAATFSPVFEFGQGTFSSAPYIHNVTATFQNTGAQFYSSNYIPAGARIENNVIYDNVTNINEPGQSDLGARSNFQGQAIYIGQNQENPGVGDTISGNTIVGSPQGGIRTVNQHSTISGNDISMNATYSNDFCADVPADYTTVSNNNCHPKSGRGFHINSNYVTISGNTISVTELKQNAEYGGCELDGAYGVQLEFDDSFLPSPPVGVQVTDNTITATAGACDAIGIRVTSMTPAGSGTFSGNTITTTNSGGAGKDYGVSFDSVDASTVSLTGNTFNSVYAYGTTDWDGGENIIIGHNTWNGTPQYSYAAVDGACDPSQGSTAGNPCPGSVQITDSIPNKVLCGTYSESSVSIGGQVTQCKGQ